MRSSMEIRGVDIVVIPAYQPPDTLLKLVRDITAVGYGVIVVDDGSDDGKQWIFEELESLEDVTVLRHFDNLGKGAALKTAYRYIIDEVKDPSTYIVTMDANGQHLPEDMERVVMTARSNPGALVLGVRDFDRSIPMRSKLGNKFTRTVFHMVSHAKVTDTQTGLRAFGYSLLDYMMQTKGSGYEYEMNVLLNAPRNGIPIVEIPIQTLYLDKSNASSHYHPLRDSLKILTTILKFASASLASFTLDYVLFMAFSSALRNVVNGLIIGNIAARVLSGLFNYLVNRNLVFRDKSDARWTLLEYILLAIGILFANNALLTVFVYGLAIPAWLAKIMAEAMLFLVSLGIQAKCIFHKDKTIRIDIKTERANGCGTNDSKAST